MAASSTIESEWVADVFIEIAGIVASLRVEEGDLVKAGSSLARLGSESLDARAEAARKEKEQAKRDLQALTKVFKGGFLTDKEYQAASLQIKQARAALTTTKENLNKTALRSPINRIIIRIKIWNNNIWINIKITMIINLIISMEWKVKFIKIIKICKIIQIIKTCTHITNNI